MKNLILAICAASLMGCAAANDAIDSTKMMPSLMSTMSHTTDQLRDTTNKMAADTREKMRLQQLKLAEDSMLDPRNTELLYPAPLGMFPGAELFSGAVTAEELAKLAFLNFTAIDEQAPDPGQMVLVNANGEPDPAGTTKDYPLSLKLSTDHKKFVQFNEIGLIAAFAPVALIDQIINDQITNHGPYEATTYGLLMMRVDFISGYLIKESILDRTVTNVGQLELAVTRTEYLKGIASLPFVDKIVYFTGGMLIPDNNTLINKNKKIDPQMIPQLKEKLHRVGTDDLPADAQATARFRAVMARIDAL